MAQKRKMYADLKAELSALRNDFDAWGDLHTSIILSQIRYLTELDPGERHDFVMNVFMPAMAKWETERRVGARANSSKS